MPATDGSTINCALDELIGERIDQCSQEALPSLVGDMLCEIVDKHLDLIPLPGSGTTLERWRVLAAIAGRDLSLLKLYEAHTDALAILAEAGVTDLPPLSVWGVWCAEPPGALLNARHVAAEGALVLDGEKRWCSGAMFVTHALLSYRDEQGQACLAAVDLGQEGISVEDDGWKAVGMAATRTATVRLSGVRATAIGVPGFYLERPGFWHGAIGIAAGWYGAAAALAEKLRQALHNRKDPHALAHLGEADCRLSGALNQLREAARFIDANPVAAEAATICRLALSARLQVEAASQAVLDHVGRALGPAPYCLDRHSARILADLPVFLRQSHAERDLAQLGTLCIESGESPWKL
ncbi:acyl-CoA dehydrogenase family protein [Herbaspirillum robiniae]|uniref:acyl-CoA dehydrogenase family protein n=1 Tax=Herbaspirillum robiniae TaxID=2014887 RepID=UPI001A9C2E5E|nr:acyl-CoA dehydrogenase family protein [Herbaspirillum robiniae]